MQAHMDEEVEEDEAARRGVTGASDDEEGAGAPAKDRLGERLKREHAEVCVCACVGVCVCVYVCVCIYLFEWLLCVCAGQPTPPFLSYCPPPPSPSLRPQASGRMQRKLAGSLQLPDFSAPGAAASAANAWGCRRGHRLSATAVALSR